MKTYKTKSGQPYILLNNGRAKFIKKSKGRNTVTKRVKRMAKKKSYRKKNTSILGKLNTPLLGAAGVVAYESFISPLIPLQGVAKDMLELVAGAWMSKKRGFIGATGKSLVVLNSYQLVSGLVGNKLQGLLGKTPTSEYNYNGGY